MTVLPSSSVHDDGEDVEDRRLVRFAGDALDEPDRNQCGYRGEPDVDDSDGVACPGGSGASHL